MKHRLSFLRRFHLLWATVLLAPSLVLAGANDVCTCSHIEALQREMRGNTTFSNGFIEFSGRTVGMGRSARAREMFRKYVKEAGKGTARGDFGQPTTAYAYTPRGRAATEAGDITWNPLTFEQEQLAWKQKHRNDGRPPDLCDFEDPKLLESYATENVACKGIKESILAHERWHRSECRRLNGSSTNKSASPSDRLKKPKAIAEEMTF